LKSEQKDVQLNAHVAACNQIDEIIICRDDSNSSCADLNSFPPVLLHKLVELSVANSICIFCQHALQLEDLYTAPHIDIIANKSTTLVYAYQSESAMKEGTDSLLST
jgi:hypothetical protein